MPTQRRWGHELLITTRRGKAKGQCSCGKQSNVFPVDDSHEIVDWYKKHTGLVEQPGR